MLHGCKTNDAATLPPDIDCVSQLYDVVLVVQYIDICISIFFFAKLFHLSAHYYCLQNRHQVHCSLFPTNRNLLPGQLSYTPLLLIYCIRCNNARLYIYIFIRLNSLHLEPVQIFTSLTLLHTWLYNLCVRLVRVYLNNSF